MRGPYLNGPDNGPGGGTFMFVMTILIIAAIIAFIF